MSFPLGCVSCSIESANAIHLVFCQKCLLEVVRVVERYGEEYDVDPCVESLMVNLRVLLNQSSRGKGSDSVRMQGRLE